MPSATAQMPASGRVKIAVFVALAHLARHGSRRRCRTFQDETFCMVQPCRSFLLANLRGWHEASGQHLGEQERIWHSTAAKRAAADSRRRRPSTRSSPRHRRWRGWRRAATRTRRGTNDRPPGATTAPSCTCIMPSRKSPRSPALRRRRKLIERARDRLEGDVLVERRQAGNPRPRRTSHPAHRCRAAGWPLPDRHRRKSSADSSARRRPAKT